MSEKGQSPLINSIREHLGRNATGFHMPGHKGAKGLPREFVLLARKHFMKSDLTELPGLDDLRAPSACLKESQRLAAAVFGAKQTFYLTNGSTLGIQASLLAVSAPDKKILIPRNAHISVLNGLVLTGGVPVLAPLVIEEEWGFPMGMSLEGLRETFSENPDLSSALLVNPEYRGTSAEIAELLRIVEKRGIPVIVDEAHGAHLYFGRRPTFSAQRCGADIVVHGAHKTLPVMTQTSLLHVNNDELVKDVQQALLLLQTTSPSYLLLASLDALQAELYRKGKELLEKSSELANKLRAEAQKISGFRVYAPEKSSGWYQDETKILLSSAELGITGWELAEILRNEYCIDVELSDYYYVLLLINFGHEMANVTKIIRALKRIGKRDLKRKRLPQIKNRELFKKGPGPNVSPRNVYFAQKEKVGPQKAVGRIAAAPVITYPPGIPLLWPGEQISREHIDFLLETQSLGMKLSNSFNEGSLEVMIEKLGS